MDKKKSKGQTPQLEPTIEQKKSEDEKYLPDTTEEKFTDLLHKAIKPEQSTPGTKTELDQTDGYSEKDTSQDSSEGTSS
jgi:hypothetical protein